MQEAEQSIFRMLRQAPLLAGDISEAPSFDRANLGQPAESYQLNLDQKLGHLYEDALEHLIDQSASVDCLARSLQIFDANGRTVGELDYVLFDRVQQRHIHLELAVKFYLGLEKDGVWQFPGPNPRDNWQRKLKHMRGHQLQVSRTPEAKALVSERFGIETIEVQQLIYGRLFMPMDCRESVWPEAIARDARVGRWLYRKDWEQHFDDRTHVALIPKPFWPLDLSEETRGLLKPLSAQMLKELATERCALFAVEGSDEPIFLVPDDWV